MHWWGSWTSNADYYIYSSLTGQKVTSLQVAGAHYSTHVYLGSARIADERNGWVMFNVTDPLLGSTRETDEAGATFPGDEEETRNELARLGTSIPHTEPFVMPPPNYERGGYVGSAEGNCTDPDTEMPIPCDMLARLENYKESTKKKKEHGKDDDWPDPMDIPGGIGADNRPMSDKISGLRRIYDPNGEGGLLWVVDYGQTRGKKLTDRELVKIAADIQAIFDANPDCLPFIQGILEQARSNGNPLVSANIFDVFWAVRNQEGFHVIENLDAGGRAPGSIGNKGRNPKARIELNARLALSFNRHYLRTQELLMAMTALNETIHHAGAYGYHDPEMGIAVAAYLKIPPPDLPIDRPPPGMTVTQWITKWSGWWHPKVGDHCDFGKVINREFRRR